MKASINNETRQSVITMVKKFTTDMLEELKDDINKVGLYSTPEELENTFASFDEKLSKIKGRIAQLKTLPRS